MRYRIPYLEVFVAALVFYSGAWGGEKTSIRAIGMAGAVASASYGLDASGGNPANIGLRDDWIVELGFFRFGLYAASDFLSYDIYTKYFTGTEGGEGRVPVFLDEAAKQEILAEFDGPLGRMNIGFETLLFGVAVKASPSVGVAFTVREQVRGFMEMPRNYVEFLLVGNPAGSLYDLSGLQLQGSWFRTYGLSAGFEVPLLNSRSDLTVGLTGKLVHGFSTYSTVSGDTRVETADNGTLTGEFHFATRHAGIDFDEARKLSEYGLFLSPAGTGFGVDFGITASLNSFLSTSLSVTDIGSIKWRDHARESIVDTTLIIDDILSVDQRKAIDRVISHQEQSIPSFTTSLPTLVRLGFAVQLDRVPRLLISVPLLVAIEYTQGIENVPGSSTKPRFSLGGEYQPIPWLLLRSGFSVGGGENPALALGLGFELSTLRFAIATEDLSWVFAPGSFSHGSIAAGFALSF
jgi:hypothetical protein